MDSELLTTLLSLVFHCAILRVRIRKNQEFLFCNLISVKLQHKSSVRWGFLLAIEQMFLDSKMCSLPLQANDFSDASHWPTPSEIANSEVRTLLMFLCNNNNEVCHFHVAGISCLIEITNDIALFSSHNSVYQPIFSCLCTIIIMLFS